MTEQRTVIRPMTAEDIPACLGVISACWDRFTAQAARPDLEAMFSGSSWRPFFYVAEADSQVVGLAGYGDSMLSYGIYSLFWHGVIPSARRRGVGERLVHRRLSDLRPVADVILIATKIPAYYEKHFGFKTIARVKTEENYGDHLMMLTHDEGASLNKGM